MERNYKRLIDEYKKRVDNGSAPAIYLRDLYALLELAESENERPNDCIMDVCLTSLYAGIMLGYNYRGDRDRRIRAAKRKDSPEVEG